MSMELMVPPAGPSFRDRVRRWLGIESDSAQLDEILRLVGGQRRDFDQLGRVLELKDRERQALARRGDELQRILLQCVEQLNRVTGIVQDQEERLTAYERNIPQIAKVKRAIAEKAKRDLAQAKKWAQAAVRANGGASQERWPFGPAPAEECPKSEHGHQWDLVALFVHLDPPVPTFKCVHCDWKWTRDWTGPEFARWLSTQTEETREKLDPLLQAAEPHIQYASEPPPAIALVRELEERRASAEADDSALLDDVEFDDLDEAELLRDGPEDLKARDDAGLEEHADAPVSPADRLEP